MTPDGIETLNDCVCPEHGFLWGECPHGCVKPPAPKKRGAMPITVAQAAAALGVSPQRIRAMCKSGRLKATLKQESRGPVWSIPQSSIEAARERFPGRPKKED